MHIPVYQPAARQHGTNLLVSAGSRDGLTAQGCPLPKKLACAAAVAGCISTPNPVACILAVAPNCLDCL